MELSVPDTSCIGWAEFEERKGLIKRKDLCLGSPINSAPITTKMGMTNFMPIIMKLICE